MFYKSITIKELIMSRHANTVYIFAVPLTHEQAMKIKDDLLYGIDEDDNDVFLFTNNNNFHRDVGMEYDENPSVPHFLGVAVDPKGSIVPKMSNRSPEVESFNKYARPVMDKYQVTESPMLHLIQQVC
jgi:hypothetical protein